MGDDVFLAFGYKKRMIGNMTASFGAYERIARLLVIAGVALLGVGVCWSVLGLYGDGSFLLLEQLTTTTFWLQNPARTFASYVTQAPVIFAMHAGVQSLKPLIYLQSVGLALPVVFWLGAFAIHRTGDLFWLFVLAFLVSFLSSGFAINGEYNFAVGLTALAGAILLKSQRLRPLHAVLLVVCSIALIRSYESTVFLGPLLILFCAARLLWSRDDAFQKTAIVFAAVSLAVGTLIAADSILHPLRPDLLAGALDLGAFRSKNFRFLLGVCALAASAVLLRGRPRLVVIVLGCALAVIFAISKSWWSQPHMQYFARTMSGLMFFAVLAAGGAATVADRYGYTIKIAKAAPVLTACFLAMTYAFCFHLLGFKGWLTQFEREIAAREGFVGIDSTPLSPSTYGWMWSNPSLSAVIKGRSAGATIVNSSENKWEPFPANEVPVVPFDKPSPIF